MADSICKRERQSSEGKEKILFSYLGREREKEVVRLRKRQPRKRKKEEKQHKNPKKEISKE